MTNLLHRVAWLLAIGLFGAILATSSPASATIVLKLDTAAMSDTASSIVMGRVEATRSYWERGRIVTEIDLRVALPIKGLQETGAVVTVRQFGGRVDELAQLVPGTPQFSVGEQALVFLETVAEDLPPVVVGMAQGKYHLAVGPDERLWAVRNLDNLSLAVFEETASGERMMRLIDASAVAESNALPLAVLLSEVAHDLKRSARPIPDALRERLDADLNPSGHDFTTDFKALGPRLDRAQEVTP